MINGLPRSIEVFIRAINKHNTGEPLTAMTADAVITDERQNYRGITAIKNWSDELSGE